jgi:hypothetical protein
MPGVHPRRVSPFGHPRVIAPAHGSPRLFAVCRALHRPLAPRHPPHALTRLHVTRRTRFPSCPRCFPYSTLCSVVKVHAGLLARLTMTSPFPARQRMAAGSRLRTKPCPASGASLHPATLDYNEESLSCQGAQVEIRAFQFSGLRLFLSGGPRRRWYGARPSGFVGRRSLSAIYVGQLRAVAPHSGKTGKP